DSPDAFATRRSDTTEPFAAAVRPPATSRPPMAERRRWAIVAGSLSFAVLLLAIAGIKSLGQKSESSESTVLTMPASQPSLVETPTIAQPEDPVLGAAGPTSVAAPPQRVAPAPKPAPAPKSAPAASPASDAKGSRASSRTSASSGKGKPKEDPFGLL